MLLSRRRFGACAICAAIGGLAALEANAQDQPSLSAGIKRMVVSQSDVPGTNYTAILANVEIEAGLLVPRHTHPGVESTYVIEGGGDLFVQGQPDRRFKATESFQVPPEVPHSVRNGDKPTKLAITYVVEKGKPLASPAPG